MHFGSMEVKAIMHQLLLRNSWQIPAGYEPILDYGTGPSPATACQSSYGHCTPSPARSVTRALRLAARV